MLATDRELQYRARIDELKEENRQLRDRISTLTKESNVALRTRFNLTETEATIFGLLIRFGSASYDQIEAAIYANEDALDMDDIKCAIRSHVKRLRRKVRPAGLNPRTVYSFGFEMDEAMRGRARSYIAGNA